MVLDIFTLEKEGGSLHNHVTFVVYCADGYYEFGWFGLGKNNQQMKSVTIDHYKDWPTYRKKHSEGQTQKGLQELIDKARTWTGEKYNLISKNCKDFAEMLCKFAGVTCSCSVLL
ncbi:hypothetical protein M0813_20620 [Anaeramoeba flamelloides]|uniref:PPPDE domain-containing protein n=1 Tax=Anaeramoeba flamelloides TaxID=1746091 RepID=A0ABQ8YKL6_9EUKA|nr:hypothetical protein M0813_20620 [Anaeramoeba flamelloides]